MSQASSDFGDFGDPMEYDATAASTDMTAAEDFAPAPQGPPLRKKGFSIYTVMLIISFVMLLVAAIMFFSQIGRYK